MDSLEVLAAKLKRVLAEIELIKEILRWEVDDDDELRILLVKTAKLLQEAMKLKKAIHLQMWAENHLN
jgi:hypothetical protein